MAKFGSGYKNPARAAPGGGDLGQTQQGPNGAEPVAQPSQEELNQRSFEEAMATANANGPGWGVAANPAGGYHAVIMDQDAVREASLNTIAPVGAPPPLPTMPGRVNSVGGVPLTIEQQFGLLRGAIGAAPPQQPSFGARRLAVTGGQSFGQFAPMDTAPGAGVPGVPPGAEPAEVDRARIDALLGNTSRATAGIFGLAETGRQFSAAEAQLAQGLDQGQRQALALARGGNRRDVGANLARAQQLGSEQAAQATQAAAGLRAQEEEADRKIRLDAYKTAGDLGLNAAALELDVNRLNMDQAQNFLNQLFANNRLQMQLDQQETERVTNFVRDMALISKDYYSLSLQERQAVRDDLTRRYGISEQTRLGLEQLEQEGNVNWEKVGADMLSGAVIGTAQVGTKAMLGG